MYKLIVGFLKIFRFMGLIAMIFAWIVILTSIQLNPWFVYTKNAFSDLGGPDANMPWVYNYGLIITGLLVILYSIYLVLDSDNKIETVGAAFVLIAGVFLMLIGIFPAGTEPHVFISLWFFIQFDLAIITWGFGLLLSGWRSTGLVFLLMSVLGPIIALLINWPSAAMAETYGIFIIDIWVLLMFRIHIKESSIY